MRGRMTTDEIAAMRNNPLWPYAPRPTTKITIFEGAISERISYPGDGEALRDLAVLAAKGEDGRYYYAMDDAIWAVAEEADMMRMGW